MKRERRRIIRVLAADDSTVMRGVMRTVFELHASAGDATLPAMELCGVARDGLEALEAVRALRPDVLLLDLEMPRLNGLGVLERLRVQAPALPVIMCSAHTERGARSTLDALALGAKDYVMKPGQQKDFASALDTLMEQLLPKIAALLSAAVVEESMTEMRVEAACRVETHGRIDAVVIGVSTGGPSALEQMLPLLPQNFAVPVMIVQHMPKLFTGALADRLDKLCRMPVREATQGAAVVPGSVWLAPGDAHMEVAGSSRGPVVLLHHRAALNSCTPSADYLFDSAARVYGAGTLALVMTGMGRDGLDGARNVRNCGGTVLAQDRESSAVWGMPGRVVETGVASAAVPLKDLARTLVERVSAGRSGNKGVPIRMYPAPENRQEGMYGVL